MEDTCELCGLALAGTDVTNDDGDAFCCIGCRDVDAALGELESVDEADLRARATTDTEPIHDDEGPPAGSERTFLRIDGMHCTTCEMFIESVAEETKGVDDAVASYVTELVRVDYDPDQLTEDDLMERLSVAGYTVYRNDDPSTKQEADELIFWRLAIGAMLGMWVMLPYIVLVYPVHFGVLDPARTLEIFRGMLTSTPAQYFFMVEMFFTGLVLFITGGPLLRGAYVSLKVRSPNMDLLVALAAVSAYLYSTVSFLLGRLDVYYDVTVAIVIVVTAGTYYESSIKHKATEKLSELTTTQIEEARRYEDVATTTTVAVDDLDPGDRVLVRAGERIPIDGVIEDGDCTVDEAIVTGESLPITKHDGDEVVGGSVLTDGAAVIEVGERATSSIDRITNLVWNLQSANHGVQKLADRLAVIFVPSVVALSVLAGVAYLALSAEITTAILVSLTVLLVSCPCALGLATPLAAASGIREALDHGIVVFDGTVFERLRSVDVGRNGRGEGVIITGDDPREGWEDVVAGLAERSIEVVVLTGEEEDATERFRRHPGIDRVFAGVPPEAKAKTMRRLGTGRRVAMVGDGTNDAPALATADLGISLGSGTALAVDAADVAIVDDDLATIEEVFDLSVAAGRRVKQNIGWAFGYNAIAIPLALLGFLNPLFATVAMATSSLLVVTNSSRTLL